MHRRGPRSRSQMRERILAILAAAAVAAASGSCRFETTTNLCEATGIRCRAGHTCAAAQPICVKIGCTVRPMPRASCKKLLPDATIPCPSSPPIMA